MAGLIPSQKTSAFMRPFVLGATAYLVALDVLFMMTQGEFHSPDRWSDIYMLLLAAYAGGAEISHLVQGTESEEEGWKDQIRKGGPLVTLWLLLLFMAGLWRIADPTTPMPPELKETAMKVVGVFFGTYALRQYRRSKGGRVLSSIAPEALTLDPDAVRLVDYLRRQGPQTPKALADALEMPRRSVARLLKELIRAGSLQRQGGPFDPSAVYRVRP